MRRSIFATAEWDSPVASAMALRDAPALRAALTASSRLCCHLRTCSAACAAAERSGTDGTAEGRVLVADGSEQVAGPLLALGVCGGAGVAHAAEVGGVGVGFAGGAVGRCHGFTVHRVSTRVNKVSEGDA